jgi:hypothetical protein
MFRISRRWLVWSSIAISVGIVVGLVIRHHQRFKHMAVHDQGMVYRCAWLEPDVFSEVIEKYQIRAVVNLCNPGEMGESRWVGQREAVFNAGARLIELPMPTSVDITEPILKEHLAILADPDNYPMLVHCQHGVTRTSKLLSMYDIVFREMSAAESLAAQPLFGRVDHNVHVRAFVKEFAKQHERTASAEKLKVLRQ